MHRLSKSARRSNGLQDLILSGKTLRCVILFVHIRSASIDIYYTVAFCIDISKLLVGAISFPLSLSLTFLTITLHLTAKGHCAWYRGLNYTQIDRVREKYKELLYYYIHIRIRYERENLSQELDRNRFSAQSESV